MNNGNVTGKKEINNENNEKKVDPAAARLGQITKAGVKTVAGNAFPGAQQALGTARKTGQKLAEKLGIKNQFNKGQPGQQQVQNEKKQKPGQQLEHKRANLGVPTKDQQENPSSSVSSDTGKQKLKNSLSNKARKLYEQVRGKKKKDGIVTSEEKKESSDDKKDEDKNADEIKEEEKENESESITPAEEKRMLKRKILIKVALIGGVLFTVFFLVMTVASALTGGGVFKVSPLSSAMDYGTDKFKSITEEDSELYQDEINFYAKIREAYNKNNGVDINYVTAVLMDLFNEYPIDFDYEDKELTEKLIASGGIDFAKMTDNFDKFLNLLSGVSDPDYTIGGTIYKTLLESNLFKDYYKDALKEKNAEEILENVFRLAEDFNAYGGYGEDETAVTDETNVTVTNNENDTQAKTMPVNEYITGSIYAETTSFKDNEMIKAYTIAYSTNIVSANKSLSITSNSASITGLTCSIKEGCSYDSNNNLVDGPGKRSDKNTLFYNGNYYYKTPLSDSDSETVTSNVNSVFGNVLVANDGTYPKLDLSKLSELQYGDMDLADTSNGYDYKTILQKAYGEYEIRNVGEGSYASNVNYGSSKILVNAIFYDQGDYGTTKFCGLPNSTIKTSGCGVTAMAIVASTYEGNNYYNPIKMNEIAYAKRLCGVQYNGTARALFGSVANSLHYKYKTGSKKNPAFLEEVINHLKNKHLVVVRMTKGHFTKGGHYMVLGGVDPLTRSVYVYDPNNKSNKQTRGTGNGWYSFNDIIVPEVGEFYIIWKG